MPDESDRFGHETHGREFVASGAKYLKYDGCNVPGGAVADLARAFEAMRTALDGTGRPVTMSAIIPLYEYGPRGSGRRC